MKTLLKLTEVPVVIIAASIFIVAVIIAVTSATVVETLEDLKPKPGARNALER